MTDLVFSCPECGKPRRLTGYGVTRVLRCRSGFCYGRDEPIPVDLKLTIKQMAEAMAHESFFNKSDDQRREQAKARRAGSTVRTFASSPYLSESEAATLAEAAEILERLGTAAEQAKKELKRRETEEELRQAARRKIVSDALIPRINMPESIPEALPLVLALAATKYHYTTPQTVIGSIVDALGNTQRRDTLEGAIKWELNYTWSAIKDDIISSIAYKDSPDAATMARKLIEEVETAKASPEITAMVAEVLDRISPRLIQERLEAANPKAGQEKK